MTKEKLIETLRAERDSLFNLAEIFTEEEVKTRYRAEAYGINTVICMLTSDTYAELIAKQHGVELDENC